MALQRDIQKVLLIFPPFRVRHDTLKMLFAPLGIAYIASVIRKDVDVEILDAVAEGFNREEILDDSFLLYGLSLQDIEERIRRSRPDIVGVSCLFSSEFPVVREICQLTKKVDDDIITITGGTHPTFLPEQCLSEPSLDMIALAEGELTMLELIRRLRDGKPFDDLDGFAFKGGDGVVVNPKTEFIEDLDSIPFPARDLLPMELYRQLGVAHSFSVASCHNSPIVTSRGCPAKCIFCSSCKYWGNRYRFRSAEDVLDEIGELVEKWEVEEIQFEDDNVTAHRNRAKAIFRGIAERGYRVKLNFPNGVALWSLDEELIDLMVEAGTYEITLAFDSGCQEVLSEIVKKPLKLEKARELTRYIRKRDVRTNAFYIIGFPGETKEQMRQTFKFANQMKTDMAYFFVANPLPGSELYEIANSRGMLREDFDFENLTFTHSSYHEGVFPRGELEKMANRAFLMCLIRSNLRHPVVLIKKLVVDLLLRRPRYTFGLIRRVLRRSLWRMGAHGSE